MIKLFICLFVGFVIGYILRIREEKQASKTNKPVCTEYGIVNPLILKLSIKKGV